MFCYSAGMKDSDDRPEFFERKIKLWKKVL